jgi:hypothetical protein
MDRVLCRVGVESQSVLAQNHAAEGQEGRALRVFLLKPHIRALRIGLKKGNEDYREKHLL